MRISVVVPTYERRDLVVASLRALARQRFDGGFEVIVVVDGSTDGTAAAVRELAVHFPLTVLEQPNRGAATARTAGGFAARGEILLFLDDDMEADPALLAEHDRSHRAGAGVVVGHMPLHPDSPPGLLSTWVKQWVDGRARRLSAAGARVRVSDLVGGQISVSREAFLAVGGFDARLTESGSFGKEDVDFGYRLIQHGCRAVFNPNAICRQRYTVRPRQYLRQRRQAGWASVKFARKHPEIADRAFRRVVNRPLFRWLAELPALAAPLRWLAVALAERGYEGTLTKRLFRSVQAVEYCRGVLEAGGVPRQRPLRVLAYHAIADTGGAGRFAPYGVPPEEFRRQVTALQRAGYQFVSADEVVHFVRGSGGLPRRPVLITFDDCYASVVEHALPILEERGIPAVAFAVTRRLGGVSDWSRAPGVPRLPLLDANDLRRLARAGVEIGAHSRTHPRLPRVSASELVDEVAGSCADLEGMGLGPVRLFAYPHGESDERVEGAVERAGCQIAFTSAPGRVRPGVDPYRLPRIEILRGDLGWRFRWKVAIAGTPLRWAGRRPAVVRAPLRRLGEPLVRSAARQLLPQPLRSWFRTRRSQMRPVGTPPVGAPPPAPDGARRS
jgi:peptidoglycan/xylan/chitin deacetylase (PgdA/CDA1 family)/GT2 family glycosyltransferase